MKLQDADLVRAFLARRQAAEVVSRRALERLRAEAHPPRVRRAWSSLATAAAAGFLLAVGLLRPWQGPREVAPMLIERPIARMALATGPTEVRPPKGARPGPIPWFACPESSPIEPGACVRTGPQGYCELDTPDGSQLRLNTETEVRLKEPRQVDMARGELWSSVADDAAPFEVHTADAQISARRAKFDLRCPTDETVLTVVEGEATVQDGGRARTVTAGEQVKIVGGRIAEEKKLADPLYDTRWMLDLLALKGADNVEFAERLNDLLSRIGDAKLSSLHEDEIRRLGEPAVWPLLRFLALSRAENEPEKREIAARIVADLAPPRAVSDLIDLLADQDPQVRSEVARALQRLTGRDQGRPADEWRADWIHCEPTQRQWRQWWAERHERAAAPPTDGPPAKARADEPTQKARSPSDNGSRPGKS
jgi:ferric-dicitrate binding protein FerR (iron transport regulator)